MVGIVLNIFNTGPICVILLILCAIAYKNAKH